MAVPVPSSLALPNDGGNTGDKLRTHTKVIGGNTVHEYFYRPSMAVTLTGRYWFSSPQKSVLIAASGIQNGTTTGLNWFQNPVSSGITGVLRRVVFDCNASSAAVMATPTVISVAKFTFTGTASGGINPILPAMTVGNSPLITARTASTGMTVTLLVEITNFELPASESATVVCYGAKEAYPFNPLAFGRGVDLEFAPGEGIVVYQSTLGTATTDSRNFGFQVVWDEIDLS